MPENKLTYSNPRLEAIIENWPSGNRRVTATFLVEVSDRGERVSRTTTGAPKKLTYAKKARIVDGSDGRTYLLTLTVYGGITVYQSNMKFEQETVWAEAEPERYNELLKLFA